jgi:tetratricopeptide (TPR) repeat protein
MAIRIIRCICELVVVALAATACAPARTTRSTPSLAVSTSGDTEELKARGDTAMDEGAYAEAIVSYKASYATTRNPALLYNIGHAYSRLGEYVVALAYLEQFATVAPPELLARVPRLADLIANVRGHVAMLLVTSNVRGARVVVRGKWRGTTPLAGELTTMPGPATIELVADGYVPFKTDLKLVEGRMTALHAVLVPTEASRTTGRH